MAKIVGIDTQILVLGIQRKDKTDPKVERAHSLLEELRANHATVIIPAVVISEFLVGYPTNDFEDAMRELNRRFQIMPLDLPASVETAKIRQRVRHAKQLPPVNELRRCEITPDCQVLGTAISRKAEILYTEDGNLIKLSPFVAGMITICRMPELTKQLSLDNTDDEE